ncbi:unannotated protein [freshwater metagenome]|uniref:Unannotated protein n=1 Tax=freshwater metagenome TaxID=449393 RepID=A0A6J7HWD5_9ZZZZ
MDDLRDNADGDAGESFNRASGECAVIELLRIVGSLLLGPLDLHDKPAQGLGCAAVIHAGEGEEQTPRMPMDPIDGQPPIGSIDKEHASGCEPLIGLVGANLDRYLTANAVGTTDSTDDDAHEGRRVIVSAQRHRGNRCGRRDPH